MKNSRFCSLPQIEDGQDRDFYDAFSASGRMRMLRFVADDPCMTVGTEIRHLDDIAAGLWAMASHAVAYDDERCCGWRIRSSGRLIEASR